MKNTYVVNTRCSCYVHWYRTSINSKTAGSRCCCKQDCWLCRLLAADAVNPPAVLGDIYKCGPDYEPCKETSSLCVCVCVCVCVCTTGNSSYGLRALSKQILLILCRLKFPTKFASQNTDNILASSLNRLCSKNARVGYVCVAELHVIVDCIKILVLHNNAFIFQIYIGGNNEIYVLI